ncbi:hypothetical protein Tco_1459588 [Tanacetum coccineum]
MYPPSGTPPLLPISLPTLSPPLHLLSTNLRVDRPEVTLPPQKRLGIALGPRYEVGESSSAPTARPPRGFRADYSFVATMDREIVRDLERDVSYRITDTWDEMLVDMPGTPATDDTELDQRMIEFTTLVIQDTYEIYTRGYVTAYYCIGSASSDYKVAGSGPQEIGGDYRVAGSRPHETGTGYKSNTDPETTTTTTVTNVQLQAMIDQGITAALGIGVRRTERVARKCTYLDFMKYQPLNFKGTDGAVELIQWFEKMETVFSISNCLVENQIKFSTCTLLADLKKKMTDKYCTRVEIKKLEAELWNLKSDKIERYVGGLPDMIHGSIVASKLKTMQEAIEIATELMDKKICTFTER